MFTSTGICYGVAVLAISQLCLDKVLLVTSAQSVAVRWRRQIACSGRFKCESGQCIDFNKVCNGFPDCRDSSDETRTLCQPWNRKCPPRSFQCSYGACIKDDGICNGKVDCMDESDEKVEGCSAILNNPYETSKCLSNEFKCNSGQCIAGGTQLCDSKRDCQDGSDESDAICRTSSTLVGSCTMPEKPTDGDFTVTGCEEGSNTPVCNKVPGTAVTSTTLLVFSCSAGYEINGNDQVICYSGKWIPSTLPLCMAVRYDYKEVLQKSLLFYEAQRSGKLPPDQKVTWRKDSALNDKGENGEDLTGGYYNSFDYIKFGFPMAHTTTVLAWGLIVYQNGYKAAGVLNDGLTAVKWATDYFLKAHVSKDTFYGQVGSTELDHGYWGRPEDMKMKRPAYKLVPNNPGSDLLGETAAALAAGYIVFKTTDQDYADKLLAHAKELFNLANEYRGKYSDSIPDAKDSYGSLHYEDELVWAATWLYKATGEDMYLHKAEDMYEEFKLKHEEGFEWQSKYSGIDVILANLTNIPKYKQKVISYCDDIMHVYKKTPKGLLFIEKWGVLGLAAKACFICMQAADMGIKTEDYRKFTKKQIGYMLGDTGRSFVVGFGNDPPTHVHHASSSCPDAPKSCDWDFYDSSVPNTHVLYGALVGGPDENDTYYDVRSDYVRNEVGCDYNSGFQSVIAGLIQHNL